MELENIDLSLETVDDLETPDKSTIDKWRMYRLKIAGIALICFCIGIGGFWCFSPSESGTGLIESLITAPRDFLEILFIMAMTVAVLISPMVIIFQLARIMKGVPKAPQKPTDTVRRFYAKTIKEYLASPTVDPEAYVYLLSQAKKHFADMDGFVDTYKKVTKDLQEEIKKHFKQEDLGDRIFKIIDVREINSKNPTRSYEVDIEATLSFGDGTLSSPKKTVGSILIRERCTLAPVGGRWYLTSGIWTGRLDPETIRNNPN